MTYEQVKWKKQTGSLHLDSENLLFRLGNGSTGVTVAWKTIAKHQVSPVSYPKSLLKLNLTDGTNTTFQFTDRPSLEKIRKEITQHLQQVRSNASIASPSAGTANGKKRAFSEVGQRNGVLGSNKKNSAHFDIAPTDLAVTRATLLAAHPNLRQQHHYLVNESKTVLEEDFWKTHQDLLEEEYARMSGVAKPGSSSLLQSHVPAAGKVTLGVEEMRQIFILYPAVHKAYEEKVPLSLSDEEFWRKYLESEYFHRDRGRMGTAARNHQPNNSSTKTENSNDKNANKGPSVEEQDARAAAVSADDLFSRYDQKLSESNAANSEKDGGRRRWGRHLAVGQFDLAQTMETERGKLLEGPRDNHPPNQVDDGKGAKVIEKYNRHWAMVLHPDEAVAGSNLLQVARRSVHESLPNDDDALAGGGIDKEMVQLSDFAAASAEDANHATSVGVREGENYEHLSLRNVEVYYSGSQQRNNSNGGRIESEAKLSKRHADFALMISQKASEIVKAEREQETRGVLSARHCFPSPKLGRELLTALTRKMAQDAQTEAASLEMVNKLPEDFRNKLQSYFRRSSELLRHFFALRRLEEDYRKNGTHSGFAKKLQRINSALENFYNEMNEMRRDLPQTETGEMMRKMCLPIMDQLDWAFKLHREGGGGSGGGFVDVGGGFVDVGGGFVDV